MTKLLKGANPKSDPWVDYPGPRTSNLRRYCTLRTERIHSTGEVHQPACARCAIDRMVNGGGRRKRQKLIESHSNTKAIQRPARVCWRASRATEAGSCWYSSCGQKGFQEPFRMLSGCSGEIQTQTLSTPFLKNSSENRCCLSHRCFASNDRVVGESVADQVCCFLTYSFRREVWACILWQVEGHTFSLILLAIFMRCSCLCVHLCRIWV